MEKDRVFFFSVLCLIIGIACGSYFDFSLAFFFLLGSAALLAWFCIFPTRNIFFLYMFFLLFCGGVFHVQQTLKEFELLPQFEKEISGIARVINDPEEKTFSQKVILRFESCETKECAEKDILFQAPKTFSFSAGDQLHISCLLEWPKSFDESFDYRMFLAKDSIGYICEKAADLKMLPRDFESKVRSLLFLPKQSFERALSRSIPEPEAGLAKGLLLGGDDHLPEGLKESFTRIGISHMVAVSGYNITLIAQGLLLIALLIGLWRKHAVWSAFFGIALFILMIGAPASAVRAGAMAGIVFGALQSGRLARPTNVLLLAAGLMLLFHPLILRYDLGFQLSFLATLGIIILLPYLKHFSPKNVWLKWAVEIAWMTLAVELFVLPVILFSFHTFSPLVIVGNFLIFLVPLAMGLSFLTIVLFLLLPGAHILSSWLAFGILWLITRCVEWLGQLKNTSVAVENFGIGALLLWYTILFFVVMVGERYYSKKKYGEKI